MEDDFIFYRRNLPHFHPSNAKFFITFRLAGSLPYNVIEHLRIERIEELKQCFSYFKNNSQELRKQQYLIQKKYFGKYDALLDNPTTGPTWLAEPQIGKIVKEKLHELDDVRYKLIAYTIMPNHVHLVFDTKNFALQNFVKFQNKKRKHYPVTETMKIIKGNTAFKCNQRLNRKGQFWHHESYDHVVRNSDELLRIIKYVLDNPVKAGLVEHWQDWPFSYCADEYIEMFL
ncbi:MAG: hypothetical protein D6707_07555 [Bacteroidetes bacterium]|nr:MAG: hypothetical protein D6707_07555 [Bacteroidota bacterium]